jgi:hypothetical protein
VGVANVHRDTAWSVSRNGNDSARLPVKTTSRLRERAGFLAWSAKVLNLCADSKCRAVVVFPAIAQNKFTNRLRLGAAEWNFRTTARRYADK